MLLRAKKPRFEAELVRDWEAFLSGRYAEWRQRDRAAVPSWAWLNLIAHGNRAELEREKHARPKADRDTWRPARAYLISEVLGFVEVDGCDLEELQRDVLVPLELDVVAEPERWLTPRNLVRDVVDALEAHQRMRRRRKRTSDSNRAHRSR